MTKFKSALPYNQWLNTESRLHPTQRKSRHNHSSNRQTYSEIQLILELHNNFFPRLKHKNVQFFTVL